MKEWQIELRRRRGREIAATRKIAQDGDKWLVPASRSRKKKYEVCISTDTPTCTCPDFKEYGENCKHIYAVQFLVSSEAGRLKTGEPETDQRAAPLRKTYPQNWSVYNLSQVQEGHEFTPLLFDLTRIIPERDHRRGRKPIPFGDIAFAVVLKIYTTKSTRRAMETIDLAYERGLLRTPISPTSIWAYLEKPELSPILRDLIIASSKPLAQVETIFAYDSTGFTGSRYRQWGDADYRGQREVDGTKVHLGCGVKTNIVTDAIVSQEGDGPLLPQMLQTTAENFQVREVLADAAFNSVKNQEAIEALDATPFIPFKKGLTGASGGAFERAFHYFKYRQEEFRLHYHKRSNVESTNSMIQAKFGHYLRSRTKVAMGNEILAKVIAHNICCLIRACYDLEIDAELLLGKLNKDAAD